MTSEHHTIVSRLIRLSRENRLVIAELERFRRQITVMFTDIRGSTAYFERFGDVAGLIMVHECNQVLQDVAQKHGGRVHKTIGDAILASFEDCNQAVHAAIAMQEELLISNISKAAEHEVAVRIGLHYGTGIVKSNDVFGDVVNVASRVESLARPEQILISEHLHEQVRSTGFKIIPAGRYQLKGKGSNCDLFEVIWRREAAPQSAASQSGVGQARRAGRELRLQHLLPNGQVDAEYSLKNRLTIGRTEGEIKFATDRGLAPRNAAVLLEQGQVFVENLSREGRLFLRLASARILSDLDVILMGKQVFEFHENGDAMAFGASAGATLTDLTVALQSPMAQFVKLTGDGAARSIYMLAGEEVRFGRDDGTYTFPEDPLLSRNHARVYRLGENLFLEDTGSRNGTYVKVCGKVPMSVGGTIIAGHQLFRVSCAS